MGTEKKDLRPKRDLEADALAALEQRVRCRLVLGEPRR
jgi:hypothetical protein